MIELSRSVGESVVIGNTVITITSVNIANKRVTLSIDAPKDISIYRAETHNSLNEEQKGDISISFMPS